MLPKGRPGGRPFCLGRDVIAITSVRGRIMEVSKIS